MTAPFAKLANEKHDQMILTAQQDQAIKMVDNNRKVKAPAKKKSPVLDIILALAFIAALAVAFYMVTAEHRGAPSFGGTPVSEMSISKQLEAAEEARYND